MPKGWPASETRAPAPQDVDHHHHHHHNHLTGISFLTGKTHRPRNLQNHPMLEERGWVIDDLRHARKACGARTGPTPEIQNSLVPPSGATPVACCGEQQR
jgi:hypothetical protein